MDIDGIRPGAEFVKTIEKKVSECDVLVAVIGERWLTSSDGQGGRRLDNPEDFVRMEIATALKREIWVIPVLVDGASIPRSPDLVDDVLLNPETLTRRTWSPPRAAEERITSVLVMLSASTAALIHARA